MIVHSRRETLKVDDLLDQTESGGDHGLRGGELATGKHADTLYRWEGGLTVERMPKT